MAPVDHDLLTDLMNIDNPTTGTEREKTGLTKHSVKNSLVTVKKLASKRGREDVQEDMHTAVQGMSGKSSRKLKVPTGTRLKETSPDSDGPAPLYSKHICTAAHH